MYSEFFFFFLVTLHYIRVIWQTALSLIPYPLVGLKQKCILKNKSARVLLPLEFPIRKNNPRYPGGRWTMLGLCTDVEQLSVVMHCSVSVLGLGLGSMCCFMVSENWQYIYIYSQDLKQFLDTVLCRNKTPAFHF